MRIRPALLTALLAVPVAALAHVGADGGAHAHIGFSEGLFHPFTGLDHLAAMLAVGVWSALTARQPREMVGAPIAFVAMLVAGALAGLAGAGLPAVEPMIAVSLLVLGLMTLARLRLPAPVAAVLVGAFALFHGVAHGVELTVATSGAAALAGMVLATALLHAAGLAFGWALRTRTSWAPRLAGAAVAVFGATMLAQVL